MQRRLGAIWGLRSRLLFSAVRALGLGLGGLGHRLDVATGLYVQRKADEGFFEV